MLWLLLCACPSKSPSDSGTTPTTPTPEPTLPTSSTAATGETAEDTAWTTTGTLLSATAGPWQACPTLGTTIASPSLSVTEVTADHVTFARTGPMEGCVFPTGLLAAQNGSAVNLHWQTGNCSSVLCVIGSATIEGLPPGTYTLTDPAPGALLTAEVTVP